MDNDNLQIIQRLLEVAKNEGSYQLEPKHFKEERLWLSNVLNDALRHAQRQFEESFAESLRMYKANLYNHKKGYGWFHNPERLLWERSHINQLTWIIYGDQYTDNELVIRSELKEEMYKDLLLQVDRTCLMTPEERIAYDKRLSEFSADVVADILKSIKENIKTN